MENNEQAPLIALGIAGAVFTFAFLIMLAINALICWFVSGVLKRLPAEHQKMPPGQVWLLMIPCFSIIWNFFVFQRVPESLASYFAAQGRTDVGDCGKGIGLAYAICCACALVPFLNYLAGPATLILLILNLVKLSELKGKISA